MVVVAGERRRSRTNCPVRSTLPPVKSKLALLILSALTVTTAACGGSDGGVSPDPTSSTSTTTDASDVAVTSTTTTTEVESTTTDASTTTAPVVEEPTITEQEQVLAAQCVSGVWSLSGFDQAEATAVQATCNDNATALDDALGLGAGDPLRDLLRTASEWIPGDISDVDYPPLLLEQTVALRDQYYPDNDAALTDDTKRAIAACTGSLGVVGTLRADITSFDDRSALDAAIETCGLAADSTSADAALDAPGISVAGLVSLDLSSIMATLASAGLAAETGADITIDDFDALLFHRIDRLNVLLPTL